MIRAFLQPFTRETFRTSFRIIVIAEAITILVAALFLQVGVNLWIHAKVAQAIPISQQVASSANWDLVDNIPKDQDSALGDRYQDKLGKFTDQYFHHDEGATYLVVVQRGEEYDTYEGNAPMDDIGKANQSELMAYATHKTTYTPTPISDSEGTYLAAYTPIFRNGKVVGLVAAEYDEGPLSDLRSVVRKSFAFSSIPALLISLVVAYVLARIFFDPKDVLRTITEKTKEQISLYLRGEKDQLWSDLTDRELEVADLTSEGLSYKEMASRLDRDQETIKRHLQNIRAKLKLSSTAQIGLEAQARRIAQLLARTELGPPA
jgi:DNA-binding CsgD family transcriptional regulator